MAESLQIIKSRMQAVKNIGQITKAMEVVSATKMRKSQEIALASRPYAFFALELLRKLLKNDAAKKEKLPLFLSRKIKKTLILVIASDRGLAGSFNAQVFRALENLLQKDEYANIPEHEFIFSAIGKKSENYLLKAGFTLHSKFTGFGDFIESEETSRLSDMLRFGYEGGEFDRVLSVSMQFRTALAQDVITLQILPMDFSKIDETVKQIIPERGKFANLSGRDSTESSSSAEYILEPSPAEVLNDLIPKLLKMQIYHIVLEANASEHSARRVAMKNASDSAAEISYDLSVSYNKARQAMITGEMIEITGTQSALA